jgi:hypothetical protein
MTKTDDLMFKFLLGVIFAGLILAFANPGRAETQKPVYHVTAAAEKAPSGRMSS